MRGQTETLQSTDQTCWNTHSDVTYTDDVLRLAPITSHKLSKKWEKTQGELPEGYCPQIPHLLVREMDIAEPSGRLFFCSSGARVTETRHICVHAVSSSLFVSWHKCIRGSMHLAAKMNTHTPLTVNKVMTKMTAICLLVWRSHWTSFQLIHKTSTSIIKKKDWNISVEYCLLFLSRRLIAFSFPLFPHSVPPSLPVNEWFISLNCWQWFMWSCDRNMTACDKYTLKIKTLLCKQKRALFAAASAERACTRKLTKIEWL